MIGDASGTLATEPSRTVRPATAPGWPTMSHSAECRWAGDCARPYPRRRAGRRRRWSVAGAGDRDGRADKRGAGPWSTVTGGQRWAFGLAVLLAGCDSGSGAEAPASSPPSTAAASTSATGSSATTPATTFAGSPSVVAGAGASDAAAAYCVAQAGRSRPGRRIGAPTAISRVGSRWAVPPTCADSRRTTKAGRASTSISPPCTRPSRRWPGWPTWRRNRWLQRRGREPRHRLLLGSGRVIGVRIGRRLRRRMGGHR